jgi:hypothetical protein
MSAWGKVGAKFNPLKLGANAMLKQISVTIAMALMVASSAAMAEPKKRPVPDKATHRVKSSQPSNRMPTYEDKVREYEELKRQGWYKIDSS